MITFAVAVAVLVQQAQSSRTPVSVSSTSLKGQVLCPKEANGWKFQIRREQKFGPSDELVFAALGNSDQISVTFHSESFALKLSSGAGLRLKNRTFRTGFFKYWHDQSAEGKVEIIGSSKAGTSALISFLGKKGSVVLIGHGRCDGPLTSDVEKRVLGVCQVILKQIDVSRLRAND